MILDRGGASGLSHRPASISGARVSETMSLQLLCWHISISFTRAGERKEAPAPGWQSSGKRMQGEDTGPTDGGTRPRDIECNELGHP